MPTIIFSGSRADLISRLRDVPKILSGKKPDSTGLVFGLLERMGLTLLGLIHDDFLVKSSGGTGTIGGPWKPLSPVTLALRRKGSAARSIVAKLKREIKRMPKVRVKLAGRHYDRLLRLYRAEGLRDAEAMMARKYARRLVYLMSPVMAPGRAKKLLGELRQLPRERAQRLAFAGALALILRDTGRLLNSLSPQIVSPDRILRVMPAAVSIGSNVAYLKYHNSSAPRKKKKDGTDRLPRRQILPDKDKPIPKAWWTEMMQSLKNGMRTPEFYLRVLGGQARMG